MCMMNHKDQDDFKWLLKVFGRMHHQCVLQELGKKGFDKVSNPEIFFFISGQKDNSVSQREICAFTGTKPSSVAVSIKRMEKAGLLKKDMDGNDQRRNFISLTEEGRKLADGCLQAMHAIDAQLLNGFSEEELHNLKHYYQKMIYNMEALGVEPPGRLKGGMHK